MLFRHYFIFIIILLLLFYYKSVKILFLSIFRVLGKCLFWTYFEGFRKRHFFVSFLLFFIIYYIIFYIYTIIYYLFTKRVKIGLFSGPSKTSFFSIFWKFFIFLANFLKLWDFLFNLYWVFEVFRSQKNHKKSQKSRKNAKNAKKPSLFKNPQKWPKNGQKWPKKRVKKCLEFWPLFSKNEHFFGGPSKSGKMAGKPFFGVRRYMGNLNRFFPTELHIT